MSAVLVWSLEWMNVVRNVEYSSTQPVRVQALRLGGLAVVTQSKRTAVGWTCVCVMPEGTTFPVSCVPWPSSLASCCFSARDGTGRNQYVQAEINM